MVRVIGMLEKFSVLLVHDEFLLVIFKFITCNSFVETERSEKHDFNYCKPICQLLR